ncbi:hypothetical protein ACQ4PT_050638 [Festuca glaucescens]
MAFALTVIVPDYVLDERSFEARTRRHSTGRAFRRARPEQDAAADDVGAGGCISCLDPASSEAIAGLRVTAAGETREECCAVCLEDFNEEGGDVHLRTMPCSHSFHEGCIFRWLRVSRVCPCCRFPLPSADEECLQDQPAPELEIEPTDE